MQGPLQILNLMNQLKSQIIDSYELMAANPEFQSLIINSLLNKDIDLIIMDAMFADFLFPVIKYFEF